MADGNWRDDLPEEFRDAPGLKDIPDVQTLAKNHLDLQKHVGNSRRVPRPDEAAEDIDAYLDKILNKDEVTKGKLMRVPDLTKDEQSEEFYRQLGKPEKAEEYTIPDFGEGVELNDDIVKNTQAMSHKYNLTQKQFEAYLTDAVDLSLKQQTERNQAHKADIDSLREEWGMAFEQNINDAVGFAVASKAPEGLVEVLQAGQADKDTLKWLYDQSKQTGHETGQINRQEGGARLETPGELRARRQTLMTKMDELVSSGVSQTDARVKEISSEIVTIGEKLTEPSE